MWTARRPVTDVDRNGAVSVGTGRWGGSDSRANLILTGMVLSLLALAAGVGLIVGQTCC